MSCNAAPIGGLLLREPAQTNFNHKCDWLLGWNRQRGLACHFLPSTQHFDGLQSRWIRKMSPEYRGNVSSLSQCAFAKKPKCLIILKQQ